MGLGRREARHDTVAAAKTAGVDPSVYWDFKPGQRVMTTDGFPGKVVAVNDGPFPGNEEYEVTLDNGMGGGQYTATLLRPLTQSEANVEHKTAADDYPELENILVERPPLAKSVTAGKAYVGTAEDEGLDPSGGKWVAVCDTHGTIVNTRTKKQAESSRTEDFCDDCRDSQKTATAQDSMDGTYESDQKCPNCGAEERVLQSSDGFSKCENCGSIVSGATASKTATVACPSCKGAGQVFDPSSCGDPGCCADFRECQHCEGQGVIGKHQDPHEQYPDEGMGLMDADREGYQPKHMASAQPIVHKDPMGATCKDCGFAHRDAVSGQGCLLCGGQMTKNPDKYASLLPLTLAAIDPSFRFHVTATFADVRNKAKRLRAEGGVNIIAVGSNTVTANVKGDHGVYETTLVRTPGKTANIAQWNCGCKWAAYSWGRTGRYKRFEGRVCSHALSLQYEAQARGMFGGKVHEDKTRPDWLRPRTRVVTEFDRATLQNVSRPADPRKVDVNRTYSTLDNDMAPVALMVEAAFEEGYTPEEVGVLLSVASIVTTAVDTDPEPPKSHHRDRSSDLTPCSRCGHPEGLHGEEGGDCTSAGCDCPHFTVAGKEASSKHKKHHHTDHRKKQHRKSHDSPSARDIQHGNYGAWWHGIGGYGIGYCGHPGCETHNGYSGDGNLSSGADSGGGSSDGGGGSESAAGDIRPVMGSNSGQNQRGQSNGWWGATRPRNPNENPGSAGFAATGDPENWRGVSGGTGIDVTASALASITDDEWDEAALEFQASMAKEGWAFVVPAAGAAAGWAARTLGPKVVKPIVQRGAPAAGRGLKKGFDWAKGKVVKPKGKKGPKRRDVDEDDVPMQPKKDQGGKKKKDRDGVDMTKKKARPGWQMPAVPMPNMSTPDYFSTTQNQMNLLVRKSLLAAEAEIHEQPEPALPHTDGLENDEASGEHDPWDYSVQTPRILDHHPDEMFPHLSAKEGEEEDVDFVATASTETVEDIVAEFQATAGQKILEGGSLPGEENDVAAAAREHLARTAMKTFSPAEQKEIIGEGEGVTASNLDRLKIEGTHYEALEAALASAPADDDLELEFS